MSFELRHLRAFVAVAEERNFTRAAARLHIAQQALSAQIRQLEERVGTRLVDRSTRHVDLTPAGLAFLEQVRPLLIGADQAIAAAHAAETGTTTLTVGFIAAITHAKIGRVFELFGQRRPDVEVFIHFGDLLEPTAGLRTGSDVDVGLVYGPFDTTGLQLTPLWADPLGALVAANHPLADHDFTIDEFLAEPTFEFPTPDQRWKDFWMLGSLRERHPARVVAQFKGLDALIEAVRAGLGVHVVSRLLYESVGPHAGVVYRELPELPQVEHFLAIRTGDDRAVVQDFLAAAREAFPQG